MRHYVGRCETEVERLIVTLGEPDSLMFMVLLTQAISNNRAKFNKSMSILHEGLARFLNNEFNNIEGIPVYDKIILQKRRVSSWTTLF